MTAGGEAARFYRPYLALFGGLFLCLLGVGASLATLPFYVLRQLHGNKLEVGVVIATIAVAAIIARPVAGRIAGIIASIASYPAIFYAMTGCAVASSALSVTGSRRPRLAAGARPQP